MSKNLLKIGAGLVLTAVLLYFFGRSVAWREVPAQIAERQRAPLPPGRPPVGSPLRHPVHPLARPGGPGEARRPLPQPRCRPTSSASPSAPSCPAAWASWPSPCIWPARRA
ncbi:MAG: hypothetical protein M0C28_48280 [Candidatus Moduliflexus flocculans]|nr:hypothetical protein [Candidatus Moduliflexus flocculans]